MSHDKVQFYYAYICLHLLIYAYALQSDQVCDGNRDCADGADESEAEDGPCHVTKCDFRNFTCDNGECVTMDKLCDRNPDCSDQSDEGEFCGTRLRIFRDEFRRYNRCVEEGGGAYM